MPDSVHEAILDAFETRLKDLNLDGLEQRVHRREIMDGPWALNLMLPCVVYSPTGIEEEGQADTTEDDHWLYPVTVRIIDRHDSAQDPGKIGPHLKWRKTIRNAFHNRLLPGAEEVSRVRLEPSPAIEPQFAAYDLAVLPLVFSCSTFEPGG